MKTRILTTQANDVPSSMASHAVYPLMPDYSSILRSVFTWHHLRNIAACVLNGKSLRLSVGISALWHSRWNEEKNVSPKELLIVRELYGVISQKSRIYLASMTHPHIWGKPIVFRTTATVTAYRAVSGLRWTLNQVQIRLASVPPTPLHLFTTRKTFRSMCVRTFL